MLCALGIKNNEQNYSNNNSIASARQKVSTNNEQNYIDDCIASTCVCQETFTKNEQNYSDDDCIANGWHEISTIASSIPISSRINGIKDNKNIYKSQGGSQSESGCISIGFNSIFSNTSLEDIKEKIDNVFNTRQSKKEFISQSNCKMKSYIHKSDTSVCKKQQETNNDIQEHVPFTSLKIDGIKDNKNAYESQDESQARWTTMDYDSSYSDISLGNTKKETQNSVNTVQRKRKFIAQSNCKIKPSIHTASDTFVCEKEQRNNDIQKDISFTQEEDLPLSHVFLDSSSNNDIQKDILLIKEKVLLHNNSINKFDTFVCKKQKTNNDIKKVIPFKKRIHLYPN